MRQVLLPPATLQYEILSKDNQVLWEGLNPIEAIEELKIYRYATIVVTAWPGDHLEPPSITIDLTPIIRQAIAQSKRR